MFLSLLSTQVNGIPTLVGYLAVIGSIAVIVVVAVKNEMVNFQYDRYALGTILLFSVFFIADLIITPTVTEFIRTCAYLSGTISLLFIIPNLVHVRDARYIVTRITALLVMIGLPTMLVGDIGLLGTHVLAWPMTFALIPGSAGSKVHVMQSIFANPRMLSFLTTIALPLSLGETIDDYRQGSLAVLAVNAFGVYVTQSRAAWLGLAGAAAVYFCYRVTGEKLATLSVVSGITVVAVGFPLAVLIHWTPITAVINLTGRGEIWQTVANLVVQHPLRGYGAVDTVQLLAPHLPSEHVGKGTHNSYLRAALMGGIVGYISYLGLCLYAAAQSVRAGHNGWWSVGGAVITILIMQAFASFSLFGIGLRSGMFALLLGYVFMGAQSPGTVIVSTPTLTATIRRVNNVLTR
ncbi:hypothetical protein A4G99_21840 [Haladaptatus sp. R4]|nr:hypothetical protein A4G99_21840 [Haladaptatus sp. R4]